jgi:hypothetical protein
MLEELLTSPSYRAFVNYLLRPEIGLAVLLPGFLSLGILGFYVRNGKVSNRLQLLWILALPVAYYCARWELTADGARLYVYSAFSVTCLLLLFNRIYVPPALAYSLTFLSLWWVDVTRAFCMALECDAPLDQFYEGVGGAGSHDALFLLPLLTAAAVAYAAMRMGARGERLVEL